MRAALASVTTGREVTDLVPQSAVPAPAPARPRPRPGAGGGDGRVMTAANGFYGYRPPISQWPGRRVADRQPNGDSDPVSMGKYGYERLS